MIDTSLKEYMGWKVGEKVLYHGIPGTIRSIVRYNDDLICVDFLQDGNRHSGIEGDFEDLARPSMRRQTSSDGGAGL